MKVARPGKNCRIPKAFLLALVCVLARFNVFGQHVPRAAEYPTATIREQQTVKVGGVDEIWRLQWGTPPKPYCEPGDFSMAITCPCTGFAYGEVGDLVILRLRNGHEIDRLSLTPFFGEEPAAVVQRWPIDHRADWSLSERGDFEQIVRKRPPVQLMHFGDYDHDGHATEFYLQTEAPPCGKSFGVVIGISSSNEHLHAFGTASNPREPLYLQRHEWEALRKARSGPVTVPDWQCNDHGASTQTEVELTWSKGGIDGVRREYSCPSDKKQSRKLIEERPLSRLESQ